MLEMPACAYAGDGTRLSLMRLNWFHRTDSNVQLWRRAELLMPCWCVISRDTALGFEKQLKFIRCLRSVADVPATNPTGNVDCERLQGKSRG